MTKYPDLNSEVRNNTGLLTLNRPKALNALSLNMLEGLHDCLSKWANDDRVHQVIVQGAGDKAFCAGGDIRSIYDARQRHDQAFIEQLFRLEYTVNYQIATYQKPYIALMDGFVFGGGCGVSVHGSHRIVTERTILAMPETCIGYFPDIGASYFLSQAPGAIGLYLGLTGKRINTADSLYAGLADACVASSEIENIRDLMVSGSPANEIFTTYRHDHGHSALAENRGDIDYCFSVQSLAAIIERLKKLNTDWSQMTLQELNQNSPFSLEVTYKLLKNKEITKRNSLIQDYRIARRLIEKPDFYEGIRAVLVDKDNAPKWSDSSIDQVSSEDVSACFDALDDGELSLPN